MRERKRVGPSPEFFLFFSFPFFSFLFSFCLFVFPLVLFLLEDAWGAGDGGAPLRRRDPAQPEGLVVDRRTWPCHIKISGTTSCRHELVGSVCGRINILITHTYSPLEQVVRHRRATDLLPSRGQVPSLGRPSESCGGGLRGCVSGRSPEHRPREPRSTTPAVLTFLRDTRVGRMISLAPREEEGEEKDSEGEEGGPGPP